jgi:hypothetical protein
VLTSIFITWKLFNGRGAVESPFYIVYVILAFLLGQALRIRTNRRILIIMLQIIFFSALFLNIFYQSVLTSFMLEPAKPVKLKTFKELLDSNHKLIVSNVFESKMKGTAEYELARSRIHFQNDSIKSIDFSKSAANSEAFILTCLSIDHYMDNADLATPYYYKLDGVLLNDYRKIHVSFLNPFVEYWQDLMLRAFEGGLPQIWDTYFQIKHKPTQQIDDGLLKLNDMLPAFYVLFIGYGLAILAEFFQIFLDRYLKKTFAWKLGRFVLLRKNRVQPVNIKKLVN